MNEVSPWLPLLLLLSCSSPFWEGASSGFMSYRQVVCDGWPRMGIPEHFENERDYQRYLALLRRVGAIETDGNGWWGLRPASRYPTLELRMTDACPRLCDTLLLANLFRVMVAFAISRPDPGARYDATTRWLLAQTAERIGEPQIFDQAATLLGAGNSASRQLACHARAMAQKTDPEQCMQRVVDHLLQESRG
jgi:carboxylate-amine ligase